MLLASHQACQESGWFLPHGRGGVEREGGSCPPMGELSIKLVALLRLRGPGPSCGCGGGGAARGAPAPPAVWFPPSSHASAWPTSVYVMFVLPQATRKPSGLGPYVGVNEQKLGINIRLHLHLQRSQREVASSTRWRELCPSCGYF